MQLLDKRKTEWKRYVCHYFTGPEYCTNKTPELDMTNATTTYYDKWYHDKFELAIKRYKKKKEKKKKRRQISYYLLQHQSKNTQSLIAQEEPISKNLPTGTDVQLTILICQPEVPLFLPFNSKNQPPASPLQSEVTSHHLLQFP